MQPKKKRGRPRSPLDQQVWIRATSQELREWRRAAHADGRTLAGWIRWVCNHTTEVKPAMEATP